MGYNLHISRALSWVDSEHYPIMAHEVVELDPGLRYSEGEITADSPPDPLVRRMLELAAELDAWVTSDAGEVYEWDGGDVRTRERDEGDLPPDPLYISRDELDADNPISLEEWLAVAAEQADFRIDTAIEATLPSGVTWIPCPPVACWTGHPSGAPVWCFHDEDLVEVRGDDPDTVRRMAALAVRMGAEVLRWDGQPAR